MQWGSSKRNQIKVKKLQQGLYSKVNGYCEL